MHEGEKQSCVIVSDSEHLRRTVHSEQANESVGFVSGVELQAPRWISTFGQKTSC